MIRLNLVNQLIMKILNTKPAPLSRPSTILWGKQIRTSGLDTAHRQFATTSEDKSQDQ